MIAKVMGRVKNSAFEPVMVNIWLLVPAKSATNTTNCKIKELMSKGYEKRLKVSNVINVPLKQVVSFELMVA
jgi:hypothetical protein